MDNKKQEAYGEVRDELLQKIQTIKSIHAKLFGETSSMSSQTVWILGGIEYALVIVDNLMLQDRIS